MWQEEESRPVQSIGVAKARSTFPGVYGCLHHCPEVKMRRARGGRLNKSPRINGRREEGGDTVVKEDREMGWGAG